MVRAGGSKTISGHARLVPAAAGAGAAVAAGPLIATVALAVAGEMLTQHQMNKKLESIKGAVLGVQRHLDREDRAVLTSAGKAARTVAGYLLDQARLPDFSSASHAFGELAQLTSEQVERLDGWLEVVAKHEGADQVNGPQLMTALVGKREDQIEEFERSVAQTYEALALSARVVVLEKIAAEFSNPGLSLPHVEHVLRDELSALSNRQNQLVGLLDDLSAMKIDGGRLPNPVAVKRILSARTSFGRLARALHAAPDGLPLLTESDQTVLELKPTAKGLSVISPASR
ncbi:hypothetical protein [Sinomonas terrae]|uniref:Uncharacterized protein n=1 Tax=Sinomonas terrae TaxID=2908838 RepID=A0ABS9U1X0_9MICC|nr:hypothetical protein [Sinomonas terrae]MCH6470674.1 hypothetical protein [Sinomonas terrae]